MNKKNLISIFIILICVLFISNGIFAYTMKENISTSSGAEARRIKEDFDNLKLAGASFSKDATTSICTLSLTFDKAITKATFSTGSYAALGVIINENPSIESRKTYASKMDDIVNSSIIANKNSDKILTNSSHPYYVAPNYKAIIFWNKLGGKTVSATYNCATLNSKNIDVYIFRPERSSFGKLDNVYIYDQPRNNIRSVDLKDSSNSLVYSTNLYYLYNVEYAYNLPVNFVSQSVTGGTCPGECPAGYKAHSSLPSGYEFNGKTYSGSGALCYLCNSEKTKASRCDPRTGNLVGTAWSLDLSSGSGINIKNEICPNVGATNTSGSSGTPAQNTDAGRGSGGTQTPAECPAEYSMTFELYPNQKFKCVVEGTIPRYQSCSVTNGVVTISNVLSFENNSDQFRLSICSSIVQENQPTSNTVASNTPQNTLEILNNSNLSDINFSLNNTNWYIVNKIDNPESYILGNKTQDKNLSINLDSFNEGPIYAIISTANKKTEIETELKQIYQTGAFTNYVRQTGTNQFKIDATFTGFSKLEYSLDNSKNLKINIKRENTLENIVLIFMQKSTDKVNLVYTNLYSLDNKSQSLFNYCMVNRNIVNFYCKGHNCSSNASCLSSGRWDFDPKIFEGLTPRAVEPTAPVVPIAPVITQQPTPPVENVTLQKGADGCYTSNPTTLAKIRQENGIGITKQQFSGKRTMSSIVLPTTNTGTDDDPSLTIAQIRTAFNRSGTNIPQKVKDASPAFYNLGLLYDIDPVFILAFFKAERSMFNQNSPSITQTMINRNDIGGVTVCRCGGTKTGDYCSYPTLEQGIEATYLNLTRGTTYSPNLYRNKTFSAVSKSWNGRDSYVTAMTGYLADTYTWAGK